MNFKEVKKTKVAYYKDELRDDFNEVGLSRPPVPEGYKYKRTLNVRFYLLFKILR